MNIASKVWLMSLLTRLVVIVIIGKLIGLFLLWLLPNEGVDFFEQKRMMPPYQPYTVNAVIEPQVIVKGAATDSSYLESGISTMVLKGLYRKKESGFIIVAMKAKPAQTSVIGLNESYGGYKLIEIHPNSAVFERASHLYTLEMQRDDLPALRQQHAPFIEGEPYQMSRAEIQEYAKNFGQILEDISITEIKERGRLQGFKITRIRPNTPFAHIGLRQGDIIIKANNEPLRSYADALNIYQDIDNINEIELIVIRNNKEKELRYEIY